MIRKAFAAAGILALGLPAFGADAHMKAGKWKITMETKMENTNFVPPPMTIEHCYTQEDVNDPQKAMQQNMRKDQDCKITDFKMTGNKGTWKVACASGTTGEGEVEYHGTTYDSTMHMTIKGGPHGSMKVTQHLHGERIGDCAK